MRMRWWWVWAFAGLIGVGPGCLQTGPPPAVDAGVDGQSHMTGDTSSANTGVCKGITCSGHGRCVESGGKALCACEEGYRPDGLNCVKTDGSSPCKGVDCNGHGTCEANNGTAACDCNTGYRVEGTTCIEIDADGDGSPMKEDCDDRNPKRAPFKAESCDGIDNNCDMKIDNGLTRSCGKTAGVCTSGMQSCNMGSWGTCTGGTRPSSETCDGKDNDCDGTTDEDCPCQPNQTMTCGKSTGVCTQGQKTCDANGNWGVCMGQTKPTQETCNGKDDDCDGDVDEGVCAIWRLPKGSNAWKRSGPDPKNTSYAPQAKIRAAYDIEDRDIVFVLTDSTIRIFRPSAQTWEPPKALSTLASGLVGTDIRGAYSIPASHGNDPAGQDSVAILAMDGGTPKAWVGTYQPTSQSVTWTDKGRTLKPVSGAGAPGSRKVATANWLDLKNARQWAQGNPQKMCGDSMTDYATKIGPYIGTLATSRVHYLEAGQCFEYFDSSDFSSTPFGKLNGAPAKPDEVGAATWHKGSLWLWRGN